MSLTDSMPIYVTRKTAHGNTGDIQMSIWMALVAMLVIWLNVIAWGLAGLYVAVTVVF
jgi:cell division protein FtsB